MSSTIMENVRGIIEKHFLRQEQKWECLTSMIYTF